MNDDVSWEIRELHHDLRVQRWSIPASVPLGDLLIRIDLAVA
jgi:hypothetical protein